MVMAGINVNSLSTYTDQDLLTIYRWALANGAAGQTREINGRSMSFPPAAVILGEIIPALEMRLAAANGGTTALVQNADHRPGPGPFFGRM
jgi:hypothetical protein